MKYSSLFLSHWKKCERHHFTNKKKATTILILTDMPKIYFCRLLCNLRAKIPVYVVPNLDGVIFTHVIFVASPTDLGITKDLRVDGKTRRPIDLRGINSWLPDFPPAAFLGHWPLLTLAVSQLSSGPLPDFRQCWS